jgi:hypothetical protein
MNGCCFSFFLFFLGGGGGAGGGGGLLLFCKKGFEKGTFFRPTFHKLPFFLVFRGGEKFVLKMIFFLIKEEKKEKKNSSPQFPRIQKSLPQLPKRVLKIFLFCYFEDSQI